MGTGAWTGTGAGAAGSESIGPKDGQGRLPKHPRPMALIGYRMPETQADHILARHSYSEASAEGLTGDDLWQKAAAFYNCCKATELQAMLNTRRPSALGYSSSAIDRATFKQYWQTLSSGTALPRAGAAGASGPAGAAANPPKLQAGDISKWSGLKLKRACRERRIPCANNSQPPELIQKLSNAGWVLPEGGR